MTTKRENDLFRALRLIAQCVNVILYNQHHEITLTQPQRELQDALRRLIEEI